MTVEQFEKLDKCHFSFDVSMPVSEEYIEAKKLLGANRFDLYGILLYIHHKVCGVSDMSYARTIYFERVRAITGQTMSEHGNVEKNSIDDYCKVLDALINDFQNNLFDVERTLIPVDNEYFLLDGAHRVACAAYFNRKVKILRLLNHTHQVHMNYEYLYENLVPESCLDAMALSACNFHDNLFVLFLWPKAHSMPDILLEAERLIVNKTNVLYKKQCRLTQQAIRNLMIQIYGHMDWVGNVDNDFESTYVKCDEVWDKNGLCSFCLIQAPSCDFVLDLKAEVRNMFDIGLASIHSTDTIKETKLAANVIFNPNSLSFIKQATPTRFKKSYKLFEKFKQTIIDSNYNIEDFIIDSSMVLSIYGIRSAADLDFYCLNSIKSNLFPIETGIEEHDSIQKGYYSLPIKDLILVPQNHFVYNEIKFVSLQNLYKFKEKRYAVSKESKDFDDMKLINMMLSDSRDRLQEIKIRYALLIKRYKRILMDKWRLLRNRILIKLHLYDFLKRVLKK